MSANVVRCSALDTFRSEWVRGHLDYQRASDALEDAQRAARRLRPATATSIDDEALRRAEQHVEDARRRLSEVEVQLAGHFDRFCGMTR
jgi:hypothetical protein